MPSWLAKSLHCIRRAFLLSELHRMRQKKWAALYQFRYKLAEADRGNSRIKWHFLKWKYHSLYRNVMKHLSTILKVYREQNFLTGFSLLTTIVQSSVLYRMNWLLGCFPNLRLISFMILRLGFLIQYPKDL